MTLGITGSARAFTVYDPTLYMQSILNSGQEIAKFVERERDTPRLIFKDEAGQTSVNDAALYAQLRQQFQR